ncbi:sarcosine oxidase subunit gamma [Roseovarius halotolerans]|uniref:Sarcosine oxidase, gamma subunit family n=1 Tax=Roseovarius halotolerans TaxID=505353 RepID=A0A1X6YGI7_9RHOB|nr:sarcosine oxidase subunit gamma family protein [Roseovarius halotolerans]RKT34655.1 sarcosine oxidase subunit gamma [Roseovarius halotolerans]SLN20816.1 Sarcosine oxidase, gamma subunit family [Roseovarius halotolerans]
MSESVSALGGASHEGFVRAEDMGLRAMITLRGDLASAKLRKAVKGATGLDMPEQRRIAVADDRSVAWMSPDELLILGPYSEAGTLRETLEKGLAGEHALVADVSDARALLRVSGGTGVREVIAKLCPVDMAAEAFGPGQFRRTRMAQIPAAIWMPDEQSVQVICFRSVAEYAFNLLRNAAAPGSETGLFI